MPLTKLQFKPGINTDVTAYSNEGGWRDGDKIRFRFGYPEKIGGWSKLTGSTYLGTARRLHNWTALDGSDFLGVGQYLNKYDKEIKNRDFFHVSGVFQRCAAVFGAYGKYLPTDMKDMKLKFVSLSVESMKKSIDFLNM